MKLEKEQIYHEYLRREKGFIRAPYQPEYDFYSAVRNGHVEKVEALCKDALSSKQGLGILSKDPLQNLKYHFVITAAMLARQCIEGGMDLSDSYGLSDFYIQKADAAKSESEVVDLHRTMSLDYAKRMRALQKKSITSMPIAKAVDYIYDHLHKRITLTDLADYVKLNPSYLSRLFKQEMGVTLNSYIRAKKIEAAENMLRYSEFTPSDISSILAFPSQSYFSEIFKQETGVSPKEYRRIHLFDRGENGK